MSPREPEKIQIQIDTSDASPARSVYRRKKTPWWQSPAVIIGGLVLAAMVGWVALRPDPPKNTKSLTISDSDPITIEESADWKFQTPVQGKGVPRESLVFELTEAPDGVAIDAQGGLLSWQPTEAQGPGDYTIGVKVTGGKITAETKIAVTVAEVDLAEIVLLHQVDEFLEFLQVDHRVAQSMSRGREERVRAPRSVTRMSSSIRTPPRPGR